MKKKDTATQILAISGTVLVMIPVVAPVLSTLFFLNGTCQVRFDYLMPVEMFLLVLLGGGLLLWAALRARSYWDLIAWSLGITMVLRAAGQGLAAVTGLASCENEAVGWRLILILSSLTLYSLAVLGMGVEGILLLRVLCMHSRVNK